MSMYRIVRYIFLLGGLTLLVLVGCRGNVVSPQSSEATTAKPYATPTVGELFIPKTQNSTATFAPTKSPEADGLIVQVDVNSNVHPISPLIYGVSAAPIEILDPLHPTLNSWGGNSNTRYNYMIGNAWNAARDWDYRNGNYGRPAGSFSDLFISEANALGIEVRLSVPTLGWVAKDDNNNTCSFPNPDGSCGNAGGASCNNPGAVADPNTANVRSDSKMVQKWVREMIEEKGLDIRFIAMDNEPELWGVTHYDVHPDCTTYSEILNQYLEYAAAIHEVAPETELVGPTTCCWWFYWNTLGGSIDKLRHGNQDFLPWFLDNVRSHDEKVGWRSLHVLDLHYYPEGVYNDAVDQLTAAHRLRSTRSLWDETYKDESWIEEPIYLIPRMKKLIEEHYPDTKFGISEWNFGADGTMNGALAIADVLGIFGREDLYFASYWAYPAVNSPGFHAFKLYTNYDGQGSRFGDTSVRAKASDTENLSTYAALDSKTKKLHLIVINKSTTQEANITLQLGGYTPQPDARRYQYSEADLSQFVESEFSITGSDWKTSLPPYSITLFVFEQEP